MLSELLEDYKDADIDEKEQYINEFKNLIWNSKFKYKVQKKYINFKLNESALNFDKELIEIFKPYQSTEFTLCKSFHSKNLKSADYIRIRINNMYGYLTKPDVYLSKEYYKLILKPKDIYYETIANIKQGNRINIEEIKTSILNSLDRAEKIKSSSIEKKINISWKEYKELINTYIDRLFKNYIPLHLYEETHGWEMKVDNDGWSEDNYLIRYFCKSLTWYLSNFVKSRKPKIAKYCSVCHVKLPEEMVNNKYCSDCSIALVKNHKKQWKLKQKDKLNKSNGFLHLGERATNKYGSMAKIIEFNSNNNILIEFDNGWKDKTTYSLFSKGKIKSPYDKSFYGHGYIGEGVYKTSENGKKTPQFSAWHSMLTRCYSDNYHQRQPTYIGCTVCDEWLNFQNFSKWYDQNYYTIHEEVMCLDKDILKKNNKIYCPEYCLYVPKSINSLFIKSNKMRGDLPIGVRYIKNENKYYANINLKTKKKHIGSYHTPKEAFMAYKLFKEDYIKKIANDYKLTIPKELYEAMNNYTVEITD